MKPNIFCKNRSSRTEDQLAPSMRSAEWRSLYHQKGETASPAVHPTPLYPRFPNASTASLIRHQRSLSEMKPVPGIEEVMPWGVFAALAAALASTAFLFVMTFTGGIYPG
ncbi:MAG: hypothetical protein WB420_09535 [Bradyrhizobium sp.]